MINKRVEERESIQLQNFGNSEILNDIHKYNTTEIKFAKSKDNEFNEIFPNLTLTRDQAVSRASRFKIHQRVQVKKHSAVRRALNYIDTWNLVNNIIATDYGKDCCIYFKLSRWLTIHGLIITVACMFFLLIPMVIIVDGTNNMAGSADYIPAILPSNENWLADTPLFYGYYNHTLQGNGTTTYSISRAYFWVNCLTRIVYALLIIRKFIFSVSVMYTEQSIYSSIESSLTLRLILGMWDYRVTTKRSALLCRENIKEFIKKSSLSNFVSKNGSNIAANILTNVISFILILASFERISTFITEDEIYFQKTLPNPKSIWVYLRSPIVISMTIVLTTWLFDLMKCVEHYRQEYWKILVSTSRIILLNLGICIILMYHWSTMIACTNPGSHLSNRTTCELIRGRVSVSPLSLLRTCWETWLGQRILIYFLVNIVITFLFYFLVDIIKSILKCWHTSTIKPKFFYTALLGNLCYMDCLLWVGFYYSPILSLVWLLQVILLFFYNINIISISCYPRGSSSNTVTLQKSIFILMLLLSSLIGIGTFASHSLLFKPSRQCGPFVHLDYNYSPDAFNSTINFSGNYFLKKVINIGDQLLVSDGLWYSAMIVLLSLTFKFSFQVNGLRKVYRLASVDKKMIDKEKNQVSENCGVHMERLRLRRKSYQPKRCVQEDEKVLDEYNNFVI